MLEKFRDISLKILSHPETSFFQVPDVGNYYFLTSILGGVIGVAIGTHAQPGPAPEPYELGEGSNEERGEHKRWRLREEARWNALINRIPGDFAYGATGLDLIATTVFLIPDNLAIAIQKILIS